MSLRERSIPVFIYPSALTFYTDNQISHKQLLTLYNPYDFPVKYQVYSNNSEKYVVADPKGKIAPRSGVDFLVRHQAPIPSNCHTRDKFMITMHDAITNQVLGKRCVLSTLLPGDKDSSSIGEESVHNVFEPDLRRERTRTNEPEPPVKLYCIALSVVFIVVLLFPTKHEDPGEWSIPNYLHVPVPVKLFIAYVLGLITMALLKPC